MKNIHIFMNVLRYFMTDIVTNIIAPRVMGVIISLSLNEFLDGLILLLRFRCFGTDGGRASGV